MTCIYTRAFRDVWRAHDKCFVVAVCLISALHTLKIEIFEKKLFVILYNHGEFENDFA